MSKLNAPVVVDIHSVHGQRPYFDLYIGRRTQYTEFDIDTKWCNPFPKSQWGERSLVMFEAHACFLAGFVARYSAVYDALSDTEKAAVMHARVNACKRWGADAWDLNELTGKVLGCWCMNRFPHCHGEIWVKLWHEKFDATIGIIFTLTLTGENDGTNND